jgi:membrane protease YdiL (CAAX protease family)
LNDFRRAFNPAHPIAVATATLCAVLTVWDVYTVVTFSVDGGPWDSLDDPVVTLSTLNEYEARTMHDEILCSLDPISTTDFGQSAKDAQQNWDDLRDEGIEIGAINDGDELDTRRDEAVALFAADAQVEPLPTISRVALIVGSVVLYTTMLFSLGWLGVILWKRRQHAKSEFASTLSMPIAGAWYGLIVFLYAFITLDVVMWSTYVLPLSEAWLEKVGGSVMVLAIPLVACVAWLFCTRPNHLFLEAFGFGSRLTQMKVRATLAMSAAVIGLDGVVLTLLSYVLPESAQANVWWESLDEKLMFGSASSAILTSLDAVVGAPVVEEIIFRGLLFGTLVGRWGFWPAALGSSLVFASLHGYELEGSISVLTTGTFLCWLYARTGRLWAPMLAHGLLNAIVVLPQFAIREFAQTM